MRTLLINEEKLSCIDLLSDSFDEIVQEDDFLRTKSSSKHVKTDDIVILNMNHDSSTNVLALAKLHDIPVLGGARLHKIHQHMLAEKFNVNMPNAFFNKFTGRQYQTIGAMQACFPDLPEKLIIKPISGARAVGISVISNYELEQFYNQDLHHTENVKYSKNDWNEESIVRDTYENGYAIIEDYINVKREFRLILTQDNYLIYERDRLSVTNSGQFNELIVGNLNSKDTVINAVNSIHKLNIDESDTIEFKQEFTEFRKNFRKLMKSMSYPWLSIDMYIDDNNQIGCFEYQMEFAYNQFSQESVNRLKLLLNKSVDRLAFNIRNNKVNV